MGSSIGSSLRVLHGLIQMRWAFVVMVLYALLIALGCESDVDRIRKANEAAGGEQPLDLGVSALINIFDLQDRDCFNAPPVQEGKEVEVSFVDLVPCSNPWTYRVLDSFVATQDDAYPGRTYFEQEALRRCSDLYDAIVFPLIEDWVRGDRRVICIQEG